MEKIDIGLCCMLCREVIEGTDMADVRNNASEKELDATVSGIVYQENTLNACSLHTGDEDCGFSWMPCDICQTAKGGTRWEVFALVSSEVTE